MFVLGANDIPIEVLLSTRSYEGNILLAPCYNKHYRYRFEFSGNQINYWRVSQRVFKKCTKQQSQFFKIFFKTQMYQNIMLQVIFIRIVYENMYPGMLLFGERRRRSLKKNSISHISYISNNILFKFRYCQVVTIYFPPIHSLKQTVVF